jgi:aldose sugar dehydrogenase
LYSSQNETLNAPLEAHRDLNSPADVRHLNGITGGYTVLKSLILIFSVFYSLLSLAAAPTLERTTFMEGLRNPWDLAFLPDGQMLFTEKCKGLSIRRSNGEVDLLFGKKGAAMVAKDFFCAGQSGMHGVALDPDFSNNKTVFIYMPSKLNTNPRTNRVLRLVLNDNYTKVLERTDIVTDIAFKDQGNAWGDAGSHSGGRIRFSADGYLYITTGDNHNGTLPQDLNRLGGKVLRVDRNGKAAAGNNTPKGGDTRIYTYGHRNVQGIAFHPTTGRAYIAEHGPNHSDEVTALTAGGNGGWDPKPDEGVSCDDEYCGYISNRKDGKLTSMTDLEKFPEAMKPLYVFSDSQGLGPDVFLTGSQWKDWNGALAVGVMGGSRIDILKLSDQGAVQSVTTAKLPRDRARSLVIGPNGNLYVTTDSGEIWIVKAE